LATRPSKKCTRLWREAHCGVKDGWLVVVKWLDLDGKYGKWLADDGKLDEK